MLKVKFMNGNYQIINNVKLGENVSIFNFVNLYGCTIGDNTKIGSFVEIQKNAFIGSNCKISSHTFICEGVKIGNGVFIGHGVTFTNDKYPQAVNSQGSLKNESEWVLEETIIEDQASIGSGCTILSGITIGKNSLIGAGSVVTKDIPANVVAYGNPARVIKKID